MTTHIFKSKNRQYVSMKNISLILFLLFFIGFVSAQEVPTYTQGQSIPLTATCDNCSQVNLTKIENQNGIVLIGDYPMTKNGTSYNYTFIDTNTIGLYKYVTCGDLNGIVTCEDTTNRDFIIKPLSRSYGKSIFSIDLTSITNIIILIMLGLTALFLFFGKSYLFSGAIISLLGIIFLFNGINFLISAITITGGVVIAFKKE